MNRTAAVVLAIAIVLTGATATAAAVIDGDEVAPDSEVYLNAGDSENAEKYVEFDGDEIQLQLEPLPPGSRTQVDNLFVLRFAGYEDTDRATTVRIESTDDRVTLKRMDTDDTFESDSISLSPGESVPFGVIVSTEQSSFSSTIKLEVDVPEEEPDPSDRDDSDDNGETDDGSGSDGPGDGGATPEAGVGADEDGGTDDANDETDSDAGGDSEAGNTDDPDAADENGDQTDQPDDGSQTLEPAGLSLGGVSLRWSLFAGVLAALTNYLVQTRIRDILPVLQTRQSIRRKRLSSVFAREAGIAVVALGLTLLVAGALSSAGVDGTRQVIVTLAFSASVGVVTGNRRFPNIQAVDLTSSGDVSSADGGTE